MSKPINSSNILLTDSAESLTTGFSMLIADRASQIFLSPQNLYHNHSVFWVFDKKTQSLRIRYTMRNEIDEKFSKSSQTRTAHALKWQWPAAGVVYVVNVCCAARKCVQWLQSWHYWSFLFENRCI